jgi:hypothetical protein
MKVIALSQAPLLANEGSRVIAPVRSSIRASVSEASGGVPRAEGTLPPGAA